VIARKCVRGAWAGHSSERDRGERRVCPRGQMASRHDGMGVWPLRQMHVGDGVVVREGHSRKLVRGLGPPW
jgi:hypothetical protein